MKIEYIKLKNFGRHDDFHVQLDSSSIITIVGKNGCGKSTILTAVCWLITGLLPDTTATYIKSDKRDIAKTVASGEILFTHKGNKVHIVREIRQSGATSTKVTINDGETITGVKKSDEALKELFGVSRQSIFNVSFIKQGTLIDLISAGAHRYDLYARLFNVDFFEKLEKKTTDKIKELSFGVPDYTKLYNDCQQRIVFFEEEIASQKIAHQERVKSLPDIDALLANKALLERVELLTNLVNNQETAKLEVQGLEDSFYSKHPCFDSSKQTELLSSKKSELQNLEYGVRKYLERDRINSKISEDKAILAQKKDKKKSIEGNLIVIEEVSDDFVSEITRKTSELNLLKESNSNRNYIKTKVDEAIRLYNSVSDVPLSKSVVLPEFPEAKPNKLADQDDLLQTKKSLKYSLELNRDILTKLGEASGKQCPVCGSDKLPSPAFRKLKLQQIDEQLSEVFKDISAMESRIQGLNKVWFNYRSTVDTVKRSIEDHNSKYQSKYHDAPVDTKELETEVSLGKSKIDVWTRAKNKLQQQKNEIILIDATIDKLNNSITFNEDRLKILSVDKTKEELESIINVIKVEINSIQEILSEYDSILSRKNAISSIVDNQSALIIAKREAEGVTYSEEHYQAAVKERDAINEVAGKIKQLESSLISEKEKELDIKKKIDEVAVVIDKISTLSELKDALSKKGIPGAYLNAAFSCVLQRASYCLSKTGQPIILRSVTEDLTFNFEFKDSRDSFGWQSYEKLSGAQKMIVALCIVISIHELVIHGDSVLCLDEPSTHIDEGNLDYVAEFLSNISSVFSNNGSQIFIVDHNTKLQNIGGYKINL